MLILTDQCMSSRYLISYLINYNINAKKEEEEEEVINEGY